MKARVGHSADCESSRSRGYRRRGIAFARELAVPAAAPKRRATRRVAAIHVDFDFVSIGILEAHRPTDSVIAAEGRQVCFLQRLVHRGEGRTIGHPECDVRDAHGAT